MQRAVEGVHVDRSVGLYMVDLVAATRDHAQVQVGASPRGSLASSSWPAAGLRSTAAISSRPTT